MPAYAYEIKVNRNREMVRENHEKEIDTLSLTVNMLLDIVGDSSTEFSIYGANERTNSPLLCWTTLRPETDREMVARIERGDSYNATREALIAQGKVKP